MSTVQQRIAQSLLTDLHRCLAYLRRDPGFGLKAVCAQFSISFLYASHIFSEYNSLSFAHYVRHIRIEAAKRLEHTALPIVLTAAECGLSDSNYFSSVFKKETGMTPSQWRAGYHCTDEEEHSE